MIKFIKKLIQFNKIKNIIYLCRDLKNNYKLNNIKNKEDPIFMVSTNRSGSSLLSSLIRQHPDIKSLDDDLITDEIKFDGDHTFGFSEDFIWQGLENFSSDHYNYIGEGFLWGHPKYLKDFYKEDYNFKNALKNEIYKSNSSQKRLFIKHSFFSLRLKLIKKIFPNASVIFNIRSYKDFITSNIDKLKKSIYKDAFKDNKPDLGLHWLIINTICYYHLEKYFPGKYFIVNHEKFYDKQIDNQKFMDEITNFLNLPKFNFNFKNVDTKYKFDKNINFEYEKIPTLAREIAEFENKIFK